MNLARHVERGRRDHPGRAALRFEGTDISYLELDQRASRAAGALAQLGVGAGTRVGLCLPNGVEFAEAYLGGLKLGAIVVSLHPHLAGPELRALVRDCGAQVLLTTAECAAGGLMPGPELPELQALVLAEGNARSRHLLWSELAAGGPDEFPARELAPESPAVIVYTSGTTGRPKGVVLSHANVVFTVEAEQRYQGIGADDRLLLFLPLHHCFGQNAILNAAWQAGATVVLHRKFDLEAVLDSLERDQVTQLYAVPTVFQVLLDRARPEQLRSVRYCFSAAAALPPAIEQRWRSVFGLPIHQGYGLTETSPFASYNHLTRHRPGSIGTPIEGVEMAVVDVESRRPLADGESGEIVIRGPNVMLGYWNQPAATAEAVRDGWFATGDVGERDAEGYYFLRDRLKDMIVVGGAKVYPAEVENVLLQHPAVAEAGVFGVPDVLLSEQVRAAVVARPGMRATEGELQRHCRAHLAAYKVPARVSEVAFLPKSAAGKILKRELRAQALAEAGARTTAPAIADAGTLRDRIAAWLGERLALPAQPGQGWEHRSLAELGLTSLQAVELAEQLGAWLGRDVPSTVAWSHPSLQALVAAFAPGGGPVDETVEMSEEEAAAELARELAELERQG